jgi:plasmid stabilization system protein ParE
MRTGGMRPGGSVWEKSFLSAVDASIAYIRRNPRANSAVRDEYRRCLVRRFPYAVFYEYSEPAVTVYAVLHTSRNPDKWRECLP